MLVNALTNIFTTPTPILHTSLHILHLGFIFFIFNLNLERYLEKNFEPLKIVFRGSSSQCGKTQETAKKMKQNKTFEI